MKINAMTLTNGTLTIVVDNGAQILTARTDHPRWNDLLEAYKKRDETAILSLMSLKAVVEEYSVGTLSVNSAGVTYNGRLIHSVDTERIMSFLREGLPYQPIANYMARKMLNPSARAINELYAFLEHKFMPITPEGMIIAYKGVLNNYFSKTGNLKTVVLQGVVNGEGQILNRIGDVIEIERSSCDDDFRNGCSFGLHAGSLAYATGWADRVILVEIDPKDVVSVPADCSCQKLRCCKYKVIGEYTGPLPSHYTNEFSSTPEPAGELEGEECPDCHGHDCCCGDDERCPDCNETEYDCTCDDERCSECNEHEDDCTCDDNGHNSPHSTWGCGCDDCTRPPAEDFSKIVLTEKPDAPKASIDGHECGFIKTVFTGEPDEDPDNPTSIGYIDGFNEETYPKYFPGDENGADSENHRLYITGYLEGYAFNHQSSNNKEG
jgi:hypothetical protein